MPTLVFDEIDTGVGGRLGAVLGKTLAELARHHQVICVTHLPQMASYADHQWVIRKQTERGRTRTTITPLDDDEGEELAAMLRGDSAAEGTRQEALAMLLEARGRSQEGRSMLRPCAVDAVGGVPRSPARRVLRRRQAVAQEVAERAGEPVEVAVGPGDRFDDLGSGERALGEAALAAAARRTTAASDSGRRSGKKASQDGS